MNYLALGADRAEKEQEYKDVTQKVNDLQLDL